MGPWEPGTSLPCTKTAQTGESAYHSYHWPSWHRHNEVRNERSVLRSVRCSAVLSELEHRSYCNAAHLHFLAHVGLRRLSAQILHEEPHRPVLGKGVGVKRPTLPFLDGLQSGNGSPEAIGRIRHEDQRLASHLSHAVTTGLPLKPPQEAPGVGHPSNVYRGFVFAFPWGNNFIRLGGGGNAAKRRVSLTPGPVAGRTSWAPLCGYHRIHRN